MFPANGGGGMAWGYVCPRLNFKPVVSRIEKKAMSLSVFQLFMPLFVSRRLSPFHPESSLCRCLKALSLVGIFL